MTTTGTLAERLRSFVGKETGPPATAPEPVNEPMIHHWCEAMGDRNPAYRDPAAAKASVHRGIVAPPTMLQAWTLEGIAMAQPSADRPKDLQRQLHDLFDAHGFTGVVATDCEQEYVRYLRPGDRLTHSTVIESISEEKATGLGIGHFINTRTTFTDQDGQVVGSMMFRVLKFKPAGQPQAVASAGGAPATPGRLRAPRAHDNGWWWEAVQKGELRIQRCTSCGVLRHPPRAMCGECQSTEWDSVVASGTGTVHSFVVMHHPQFPGYEYPILVGLIDLAEGTRLVTNLAGIEPERIRIGMPVRLSIEEVEEGLRLPLFRPVEDR